MSDQRRVLSTPRVDPSSSPSIGSNDSIPLPVGSTPPTRRSSLAFSSAPRALASSLLRRVVALPLVLKLATLVFLFLCIKVLPLPFTPPISVPHPIPSLLREAEALHASRLAHRPTSLRQAHDRYLAQHARPPPKGYDAWYSFAQKVGACRVEGYDEMYRSLAVWWGVEGGEIRDRIERIGVESAGGLGRVRVRDGRVVKWEEMGAQGLGRGATDMGGSNARTAWEEMLEELGRRGVRLPDVDFFINQLDEPRVVLPYELRTDLEKRGRRNKPRPKQVEDLVLHDINAPSSLPAYDVLRKSCPPSSAARRARLSSSPGSSPHISQRYTSSFTTRIGSFLSSPELERQTWCDQPDLQELHQTLIRPLSFSWTDQLFPVFSNSKIEGFADVLVPSWFHWYGKMPYHEEADIEWKGKTNQLFWRGTNTGGKSVGLNWMGWLRSRLVSKTNRPVEWAHHDTVLLSSAANHTVTTTLPSSALNAALTDIAFAAPDHHGDASSLETQRTEPSFRFTGMVPFSSNFAAKAILDMDGTAYSGRFPALMASRSAVFKSRLFVDAFDDAGLVPWFHYVPLSVRLSELYNLLGYFFGVAAVPAHASAQGFAPAPADLESAALGTSHEEELYRIAVQGREWAQKCARREDALVHAYLLVLEWARLCSDEREGAGMRPLGRGERY
ncbi:hypothetical protein JCM5296_000064 [Sporobolomyces johnsonii]